jgi:GAF domain-containing protein
MSDAVGVASAEASSELLPAQTVQDMLYMLSTITADAIPGAAGAGISLISEGGLRLSTAVTDPVVMAIDAPQYELDEGPCLTSWATGETVRIDDVATDVRWPRWSAVTSALGVHSLMSAPLVEGLQLYGAMKVYSRQRGAFDDADEEMLLRIAEHAAVMLGGLRRVENEVILSTQLRGRLSSPESIAQAQGMVMERAGVDAGRALVLLAEQARAHGRSMADEALVMTRARTKTTARPPAQSPGISD